MVQYQLFPHILLIISSLFLSFINTRQPSTFLPFCSALSHPFWIYNRAFLIRLFSRIRSSAWILLILFPPFHDNTCSAGAWLLARNSWHTAQELSTIVSVQTAEFINKPLQQQISQVLITVSVSFAYKYVHFPCRAAACQLHTRQNTKNMIRMLAERHVLGWSQCAETTFWLQR